MISLSPPTICNSAIFVGAYSNDRDCTFDLMREGLNRAWEIVEGNRQLRDGEFND
ncbi:hypothetical protein [Escherichia albertii]|uniref:hypothetical protein n=1 Tax=Escherichia albertii TaxID=208962 RepID=UPI00283AA03A|nr:hypothetical protein [Escherichia albertii]WMV69319.1 hypothetical protein Q0121_24600 [Escherichia albertii]